LAVALVCRNLAVSDVHNPPSLQHLPCRCGEQEFKLIRQRVTSQNLTTSVTNAPGAYTGTAMTRNFILPRRTALPQRSPAFWQRSRCLNVPALARPRFFKGKPYEPHVKGTPLRRCSIASRPS